MSMLAAAEHARRIIQSAGGITDGMVAVDGANVTLREGAASEKPGTMKIAETGSIPVVAGVKDRPGGACAASGSDTCRQRWKRDK